MAAQAGPYLPTLFPMVARYVSDRDSDIRQAVAYGIALCAQLAGDGFKPFCAAATQSLIALIQDPQARQAGLSMRVSRFCVSIVVATHSGRVPP